MRARLTGAQRDATTKRGALRYPEKLCALIRTKPACELTRLIHNPARSITNSSCHACCFYYFIISFFFFAGSNFNERARGSGWQHVKLKKKTPQNFLMSEWVREKIWGEMGRQVTPSPSPSPPLPAPQPLPPLDKINRCDHC